MNEILISIISVIITGVLTLIGGKITQFINLKIYNVKLNNILNEFNELVTSSVMATYQTYVEELKANGIFDLKAQKEASEVTKQYIMSNIPIKVRNFIKTVNPNFNEFVNLAIEKAIYELKKR